MREYRRLKDPQDWKLIVTGTVFALVLLWHACSDAHARGRRPSLVYVEPERPKRVVKRFKKRTNGFCLNPDGSWIKGCPQPRR